MEYTYTTQGVVTRYVICSEDEAGRKLADPVLLVSIDGSEFTYVDQIINMYQRFINSEIKSALTREQVQNI